MTSNLWLKQGLDLIRNYEKRAPFALVLSLVYNLLFALFKLIAGIMIGSYWMIGLAAYYGCLAIMRYLLLLQLPSRDEKYAWRAYHNTGLLLLVLTLIIGGIVGQTYIKDKTYDYPGFLIYAFAAFAFGKIITVTRTLFKRRHESNIILRASRCVSFAHALMSILSLQIALLSRFCIDNPGFARLMNGLTGGAVFLLIHTLAVYMLHRGRQGLKKASHSPSSRNTLFLHDDSVRLPIL